MKSRAAAGIVSGSIAGIVMAMAMMAYMYARGQSVWTNPDLIAAMWMENGAADGRFSLATLVGFATHLATSALMGLIAVPFIKSLSFGRTILASFAYTLASYPFVFAFVLTWSNPLMVERSELVPMTAAHILFGVVLGIFYKNLFREQIRESNSTESCNERRESF